MSPAADLRAPAFAPASDPSRLLAAVADALNQCERHGLVVDLEHGAALTTRGYVLPVGDCRLGSRWAVRSRLEAGIENGPREPGRVPSEQSQQAALWPLP